MWCFGVVVFLYEGNLCLLVDLLFSCFVFACERECSECFYYPSFLFLYLCFYLLRVIIAMKIPLPSWKMLWSEWNRFYTGFVLSLNCFRIKFILVVELSCEWVPNVQICFCQRINDVLWKLCIVCDAYLSLKALSSLYILYI